MVITQNHDVLNETAMCRRKLAKIPDVNFHASQPVGVKTFHVTLLKCLRSKLSCTTSTIYDIEPR